MKLKQLLIVSVVSLNVVNGAVFARTKKDACKDGSKPKLVKVEKEASALEIKVNNPDLLVPFTVLKKHKGSVAVAAKDPKLVRKKSKVRKAYQEARGQIAYFKGLVKEFSSVLNNTQLIEEDLKDPYYAPLLKNVGPCAQDVVATFKDLIVKTTVLADMLESEMENNEALKSLLGQSHIVKKDTTKKC